MHVLSGVQILAIPIDMSWNVGACHETKKGAMRKKDMLGKPWKVGEVSGILGVEKSKERAGEWGRREGRINKNKLCVKMPQQHAN